MIPGFRWRHGNYHYLLVDIGHPLEGTLLRFNHKTHEWGCITPDEAFLKVIWSIAHAYGDRDGAAVVERVLKSHPEYFDPRVFAEDAEETS